ncbi:MAG: hypothetical protein QXH75_04740 [Sulfolobaceae archaeon]|jgi:uncharacterized protein YutE (UPF0331/DUF86 family)
MVEEGTLVDLEEFKRNKQLKERVKEGIIGLINVLMSEISLISTFNSKEDAILNLVKMRIISGSLAQELLDILEIANNLNNVEDEIVYGMLVRIMEDIEQAVISINEYKNSNKKN